MSVQVVVKFPNQKVVSVSVMNKCGTSTTFGTLGFPRIGKVVRNISRTLRPLNEYWEDDNDCPFNIDYKIAIVRDPVDRMYSVYKQRILSRNWENIKDDVTSWDMYVKDFKRIRNQYKDISIHTIPQVTRHGTDPKKFDFVYNTNELANSFIPKISVISGVNIPNNIHMKLTKDPKEKITKEHRELIQNYFADDYKYWGYYFQ